MQWKQCPLCFTELEAREGAPCAECGGHPEELIHFHEGRHTFRVYRVFGDLELTLCEFCRVDFGSHDPQLFSLTRDARIGFQYAARARRRRPRAQHRQVLPELPPAPCVSSMPRASYTRSDAIPKARTSGP